MSEPGQAPPPSLARWWGRCALVSLGASLSWSLVAGGVALIGGVFLWLWPVFYVQVLLLGGLPLVLLAREGREPAPAARPVAGTALWALIAFVAARAACVYAELLEITWSQGFDLALNTVSYYIAFTRRVGLEALPLIWGDTTLADGVAAAFVACVLFRRLGRPAYEQAASGAGAGAVAVGIELALMEILEASNPWTWVTLCTALAAGLSLPLWLSFARPSQGG